MRQCADCNKGHNDLTKGAVKHSIECELFFADIRFLGAGDYMESYEKKTVCVMSLMAIVFLIVGCGEPVGKKELAPTVDLGTTIGSLAEVVAFDTIGVEGYALIGGLNGTGSAECPRAIRGYLKKYIQRKLPEHKNIEGFISSGDTAVVRVSGLMPAAVSKNQRFDVKVAALPGTQTTSLEGGELWGAELYEGGKFGLALKALAEAEGPVFIDTIEATAVDKRVGYVLGGGRVLDEYKIGLALRRPDFRIANAIRNHLNARFPPDTAKAVSSSVVQLKVPAEYAKQKERFMSLIRATYLTQTPEVTEERINTFVRKLVASDDKDVSEIALEAIGRESLGKLPALLNSSNEQVRLRAGRCMLHLGDDRGLKALREIAIDERSASRIAALEAITMTASRTDAGAISRRLLRDRDFEVRLAAYEQLRKLDDIAIRQKLIANKFYLEQIAQTRYQAIYASRSGEPRVALFGSPIYCRENVFVQSRDGNITINALPGERYVSVVRKYTRRPDIPPIKLRSTYELGDIIQTLCEEPVKRRGQERPGLGVSYADMIAILKQMSDKGVVRAEFRAGSLPEIGL